MVRESVDEEDQCSWWGCGLRMMKRLVRETCGIDQLFNRPSMSLCMLYSHLEGYASSLASHSPPLLQKGVKGR